MALLRNSRIDGDLSMRLRVWSKMGPSFEPFLFNLCWNMIEPSGILFVADGGDVASVLVEVAFFNVCIEWSTALPFPPFNDAAAAASAI